MKKKFSITLKELRDIYEGKINLRPITEAYMEKCFNGKKKNFSISMRNEQTNALTHTHTHTRAHAHVTTNRQLHTKRVIYYLC